MSDSLDKIAMDLIGDLQMKPGDQAYDIIRTALKTLASERDKYKAALTVIANYDNESIWMDDRDDAAGEILELAAEALK